MNELSRPSLAVIPRQRCATSAGAEHQWVVGADRLQIIPLSMLCEMMLRRKNFNVASVVVGLVAVKVVDVIGTQKRSPEFLARNQPVLIGIAVAHPHWMAWSNAHQYIAICGNASTALPLGAVFAVVEVRHTSYFMPTTVPCFVYCDFIGHTDEEAIPCFCGD